MKNKLRIKTSAWLICMLLFATGNVLAQNPFCEDFNTNTNTPFTGPGCTGTPVDNVLGNWGTINTNLGYSDNNSINGAGDVYLHIDDGSCGNGASFIYNALDYAGNWLNDVQGEGCFCFDLRTFHIQVGTLTPNTLRLYDGPNPQASTLSATFVLNGSYDVSRGWVRICAPIELSDGVNLPSNADGQWVINTGNAADWDTLVAGVGSIGFLVDVGSGNEEYGLDNICVSQECDSTYTDDPPTEEGAYCCDESENLVTNGNFEFGDNDFSSDYTQNPATVPGQYDVTNDSSAFGTAVTDHSFCEDPNTYATNDQFLLVNGLTNQPSGSQSVIWEQTIAGLDPEKEYRFCGNFKDLPQCTFNIFPEITIQLSNGVSETVTVMTDPTDPCDWQNISFCFRAQDEINIQILLNEDGLGDGNDLAIDDLSVQELRDPGLSISVLHQGNPQEVTGSINSIDPSDDQLPFSTEICDEPWYWYVFVVDSFSGGTFTLDFAAPYGWGNDTLGSSLFNPAGVGPNWDLTTQFPGYPFAQNELYLIGMYTPSCCEDCVDDGFTYQIILNNREQNANTLSEEDKARILEILGTYQDSTLGNDEKVLESIRAYPNPAKETVTVTLQNDMISEVKILGINGQIVFEKQTNESKKDAVLDVSKLSSGMYFIQVTASNNRQFTSKLIIE